MSNEKLKKDPEIEEKVSQDEFVFLNLDKRRELKFGFKGMKLLEETYKKEDGIPTPFLEVLNIIVEKCEKETLCIDDILNLIWCGLIKQDKELTRERTEELLEDSEYHLGVLGDLIVTIFNAVGASTPDLKKKISKKGKSVTLTLPTKDTRGKKTGHGKN